MDSLMAKKRSKNPMPVYQLRITLREVDPPILRILQIKGNANLGKLHDYIQGAMGWQDYHLHEFKIKGKRYRAEELMYEDVDESDMRDERDYRLNKLLQEGDCFEYVYDYGDYWEHEILVEKIVPAEEGVYYPICTYGERACPPEDCGGPGGYEELLKVLSEPDHEDYKHLSGWAGKDFDSEKFDAKKTDRMLRNIKSNLREPRGNWI
jgi:hypothetical protein